MSSAMRREVHLPRGCLCLSRQAVWPSQDGSYLGMHLIGMGFWNVSLFFVFGMILRRLGFGGKVLTVSLSVS